MAHLTDVLSKLTINLELPAHLEPDGSLGRQAQELLDVSADVASVRGQPRQELLG
jgi:hypothetical protein